MGSVAAEALNAYQESSRRTRPNVHGDDLLHLAAVGIFDECGEIAGLVKKKRWQGHTGITRAKMTDEIGDAWWYVAAGADAVGQPLGELVSYDLLKKEAKKEMAKEPDEVRVFNAIMRLASAVGRLADALSDPESQRATLIPTWLSVVAYRLICVATVMLVDTLEALNENVVKIDRRFPNGFTPEASMARVDVQA